MGVEARRATGDAVRQGQEFWDWGIPTAASILQVQASPNFRTVIATGGIQTGLDVARAIALGATACGASLDRYCKRSMLAASRPRSVTSNASTPTCDEPRCSDGLGRPGRVAPRSSPAGRRHSAPGPRLRPGGAPRSYGPPARMKSPRADQAEPVCGALGGRRTGRERTPAPIARRESKAGLGPRDRGPRPRASRVCPSRCGVVSGFALPSASSGLAANKRAPEPALLQAGVAL